MGKAADNGRIELRATFYNNVAVTALVGGPVLAAFVALSHQASPSADDMKWPLIVLFAAWAVSFVARRLAERWIGRLQD